MRELVDKFKEDAQAEAEQVKKAVKAAAKNYTSFEHVGEAFRLIAKWLEDLEKIPRRYRGEDTVLESLRQACGKFSSAMVAFDKEAGKIYPIYAKGEHRSYPRYWTREGQKDIEKFLSSFSFVIEDILFQAARDSGIRE